MCKGKLQWWEVSVLRREWSYQQSLGERCLDLLCKGVLEQHQAAHNLTFQSLFFIITTSKNLRQELVPYRALSSLSCYLPSASLWMSCSLNTWKPSQMSKAFARSHTATHTISKGSLASALLLPACGTMDLIYIQSFTLFKFLSCISSFRS